MKRLAPACLVAIVMFGSSTLAFAGHPQKREGFWIGAGFGCGSASFSADCDDCGSDREDSFTGHFRLGGTLSERVLLGAETNVWVKEEDDTTLTLGSVTGTVTFYPVATSGFFLKGGLGFSLVDVTIDLGSSDISTNKSGWGFLAGIGYDLRVGGNFSLSPTINYWYGKPGDVAFEDDVLAFKQNVISFELGFTFH